jgi:hypothetical protein
MLGLENLKIKRPILNFVLSEVLRRRWGDQESHHASDSLKLAGQAEPTPSASPSKHVGRNTRADKGDSACKMPKLSRKPELCLT